MAPPLFLDRAGEGDLDGLLALDEACSPNPWTRATMRTALEPGRGYSVLVLRAPLVAPGALAGYCCFQAVVDEVHVHNVAVGPSWRGRGLGRLLVGTALSVAARAGARLAFLEVRAGNAPALALYRALGFAPLHVRRGYYESPREDAVVMRRGGLGPAGDIEIPGGER